MSTESPASVLFSSDGTELAVVNNVAIPSNTRALLISGVGPDGYARYVPSAREGALGTAEMSNDFPIQSAATVTASGSQLVTANWFGTQEIALIVNVGTVTGAGSIQYTIQEVDPGDGVTVYGNSATTSVITTGNAPGVFTAVLNVTTSPMVRVSWTVTGTFSATIYATVVTKGTPSTQTINGTVTATNSSVGADGAAALGFDTQVGGKVTTAAPTYVTGNLDALSLTTLGGLRIDGVYATGTANATAADAMVNGGYVTTAAPTYTTGQLNALSLDTAGNLRVLANQGTSPWVVSGSTASTFNNQSVGADGAAFLGFDTQVGGRVTTAAPTYTTGNLDALSLTTLGGLRVDGVYAAGTANATAADVMNSGGYVTTAAPTYTTGQLNPLSLTTAGSLRVDGTGGVFNNQSVGATAAAPPADATYMGALVTTAAESGLTNGDMYPLNLTTTGQLRIDSAYPNATAVATAVDMTQVGGVATTAAPTYTTATINPLSLDLAGNLRVTGFVVTDKATTSAFTQVAGATVNTSVLASNATRIRATIYNNTTKNMYVLYNSAAATTSNFSILLMKGSYTEVPDDYTGAINAIWDTGVSGSANITEFTP